LQNGGPESLGLCDGLLGGSRGNLIKNLILGLPPVRRNALIGGDAWAAVATVRDLGHFDFERGTKPVLFIFFVADHWTHRWERL